LGVLIDETSCTKSKGVGLIDGLHAAERFADRLEFTMFEMLLEFSIIVFNWMICA
jgi:hypothetical protein